MSKRLSLTIAIGAGAVAVALALALLFWPKAVRDRVSEFGKYAGYSEARYDGTVRRSDYLTLPDGTRLAYDLLLPTRHGKVAGERLPTLFKYTPYLRTWTIFDAQGHNLIADFIELSWTERAFLRLRYWLAKEGRLFDPLFRTPWLKPLLQHGYAVLIVERPGTGASFGVINASFEASAQEIDVLLNWIAAQPWSDGKVGMFGDSFQAMVQIAAAGTGNPHLKAIFPASVPIELYDDIEYRGGVYSTAFTAFFAGAAAHLETLATPVDRDTDGALLAQARKERTGATLGERLDLSNPAYSYRDSLTSSGRRLWDGAALYAFVERITRSGVAVYATSGWYDIFSSAIFFWEANLTVPRRIAIRPSDHTGMDKNGPDLDYGAEAHRWFDYWLKGIPNGIMDEPGVHYTLMGVPAKDAWRAARQWPPANRPATPYYFGPGPSGSSTSVNDGGLVREAPVSPAEDAYAVDYSTTTGRRSRWSAVNHPRAYPDLRAHDAKALTYTTAPLSEDLDVVGFPVAALWLRTDAPDLDVFVYLEEVDPGGASTYITEGTLRASHRRLGAPPFRNFGLPYHSHFRSDAAPIPAGEPVSLTLSLLPTAYRFHTGNRLRVTVAFADADNFATPVLTPAPHLRLLRDPRHPSRVLLPVLAANESAAPAPKTP